ncbi:Cacna1c [Symbiodinium necroappetens]|uniref:Cacna1c protein n=1 Tax=Symbiodinium necroappetens TaxID=1628268 RepID=A0A812WMH0_9DINO|nr:Cacna1c [Symbiodinium necroappetens]
MDVTELVQGMLKIRGDVKKSDTVATLLATKALQEMVSESRHAIRTISTTNPKMQCCADCSSSACGCSGPTCCETMLTSSTSHSLPGDAQHAVGAGITHDPEFSCKCKGGLELR